MTDTYVPSDNRSPDYGSNDFRPDLPGRPIGMPDVPFGSVENDDVMPFSWAERGLTWLHQNRPQVFADMMLHVMRVERAGRKAR